MHILTHIHTHTRTRASTSYAFVSSHTQKCLCYFWNTTWWLRGKGSVSAWTSEPDVLRLCLLHKQDARRHTDPFRYLFLLLPSRVLPYRPCQHVVAILPLLCSALIHDYLWTWFVLLFRNMLIYNHIPSIYVVFEIYSVIFAPMRVRSHKYTHARTYFIIASILLTI